jgi:predicted SAM-dependent methyltransferase
VVILHLGGGDDRHEGQIDKDPTIDGWRFEYGLDFEDETVDGITISHALMYAKVSKLSYVFSEFYRVLKPGGVIRITEDDTEDPLSRRYKDPYRGATWATGPIALTELLNEAGFDSEITQWNWSNFPTDQLLIYHREHTKPAYYCYVEGVKPK